MKILYLMYRFPYPLDKGDKLRAFNFIKQLSKNHEIYLVSIIDEIIEPQWLEILKKYTTKIYLVKQSKIKLIKNLLVNLFNGKPLQNAFVYDKALKNQIKTIIEETECDIAICLMVRPAEYLIGTKIKKILDYQDALSIGFERRSKKSSFPRSLFYKMEAERLKKFERFLFDKFDLKLIITDEDKKHINHQDKYKIVVIQNGIDTSYFTPELDTKRDIDILFVGNMQYEPNILCVKYIVNEILPRIKLHKSNIKLMIAGAEPTKEVQSLADEDVIITGKLDDIRQAYNRGKIFLAPMQTGTGLQNKLLEAMAMKLPVVTSELCNKALLAKENEQILIGRSPSEYAEHCIELLNDSFLYEKISNNGYNFVINNFSWEHNIKKLNELIDNI